MRLGKMFERIEGRLLMGDWDIDVEDIVYDSRNDMKNKVYVCLKGIHADGHDFIWDVIKNGANAVVTEQGWWGLNKSEKWNSKIALIEVKNTREALGEMSRAFFDFPENELVMVGITGTKGKTTVTAMLAHILNSSGIQTGTMGTLGCCIKQHKIPLANTTPESYIVQKYLRKMVLGGCKACVMEVSSQAVMCGRIQGVMFDYAVMTNLYPDHIGPSEHKDFEDYKYWKGQMLLQSRHCIVNGDDPLVMELIRKNNVTAEIFFRKEFEQKNLKLNLLGDFNEYNALAAARVARHMGVCADDIRNYLGEVKICGRCEIAARHAGGLFVIDYAHNGQSLELVLKTLKTHVSGRLICIFGCGGNRAKIRRKSMAQAAYMYADEIIITSDNPRYEDPGAIIRDIEEELQKQEHLQKRKVKYRIIEDRKAAIKEAFTDMRSGDIVLLAGKGHETYQEIKGVKIPFDERQIIAKLREKSV